MRARRSWRAPWHYPTVAIGARRCVGVGFSALPRRLRRVDRRNRSRSCQRFAIPSTLFAFGPRPASRQPGTRTFVIGRELPLQTTDFDCADMRSTRQRPHAAALRFPAQIRTRDRTTCRCAWVVTDTLPPRLRLATTHSPNAGETQLIRKHRTCDFALLPATAQAQFTTVCHNSITRASPVSWQYTSSLPQDWQCPTTHRTATEWWEKFPETRYESPTRS